VNPQEIRNAAEVMREGWKLAAEREPTEGELLYSLLVAKHETSFGRGWKGEMAASNNWGAVQCGATSKGAACIEWQDTHPDGRVYKVSFRAYASPAEGAADVVRHLTKYRPGVGAVMARKGSLFEFGRAMREEKYYGGFCPKATKAGGTFSYGTPKKPSDEACHEEAIAGWVKANEKGLRQVAEALGIAPPPVGSAKEAPSVAATGGWAPYVWGALFGATAGGLWWLARRQA